jgi:peroxiredoxin Q/BCP
MKRLLIGLAPLAFLGAAAATPALAAIAVGAMAPDFSLPAALGGKDFTYDLASNLKKGPAVVYFYPKAFTKGCSAEAHEFSQKDCASKFPVAADPDGKVIQAYDVKIPIPGAGLMMKMDHPANRTSFLVAPDGKIIAEYSNLDASKHVSTMLADLKAWRETHKA